MEPVLVLAVLTVGVLRTVSATDLLPAAEDYNTNDTWPVILEEPETGFATKEVAAILHCKAAHATRLYFTCNEEEGGEMKSLNETESVDPATGIIFKEAWLQVRRRDIMDILGEFSCQCVAESEHGTAKSSHVPVDVAYLRKDFETPPYSSHIEVGSQAELRCHPPKGNPPARVIGWLKNGKKIDTKVNKNFIISSSGHLLVLQAELNNTGNYSCIAANIVRQRVSPPALLTIYIPGNWGSWSAWSDCDVSCGRGVQVRHRACDSPAPVNGGPGCEGSAIQKKSCNVQCPAVDGSWGAWSAWSPCSADCLHVRRRSCSDPAPANGGRYCQGKDIASKNCTGGMCRPQNLPVLIYTTQEGPVQTSTTNNNNSNREADSVGGTTSDFTLFVGLAVAFLIFVFVLVVIIRLLYRRRMSRSGYSSAVCGGGGSRKSGSYHTDLSQDGRLRLNSPPTVCYEYTYSDNNSNNSSKSGGFISPNSLNTHQVIQSDMRPLSEHFYEQPMRVMQNSRHSPTESLDRKSSGESTTLDPSFGFNTVPSSLAVPRCADLSQIAWTRVGEKGARISIPRSTVSLTVPAGAIEPGRSEEIWISVVGDDHLRPHLDHTQQVMITPVVIVGPFHLTAHLKKPVVLSIPHIGGHGLLEVQVLQCDRVEGCGPATWKCVAVSGQEDANSSTSVYVDSSMCQLVTEKLAAFSLVAKAAGSGSGSSSRGGEGDTPPPFRIPMDVKQSLCLLLDPPNANNSDWRQLAERLGVNRYINFFGTQASPTEAILNLWEARNRESTAVAGLVNTLRAMGRHDAARVLDRDTSWP